MSTPDPLASLPANFFTDPDVAHVSIAAQDAGGFWTATTPGDSPAMLFQACSISKPVAALAAMVLVGQGKLGLDDDVNTKLKTWKLRASQDWPVRVTLRHLLWHGGAVSVRSFPGYPHGTVPPGLPKILNGESPCLTPAIRVTGLPGVCHRYSGGGYTVIQQLIEDVTGVPFAKAVTDLVFRPLGMISAQYSEPDKDEAAPGWLAAHPPIRPKGKAVPGGWRVFPELAAAGLWCTAADLVKFAAGIQSMAAGVIRPAGQEFPLSQALAKEMLSLQMPGWGLGVELAGSGTGLRFGHRGDNEGYSCEVTATVAPGPVIAVMTSSNVGQKVIRNLLPAVRTALKWPDRAACTAPAPGTPLPEPLPTADELALLPVLYGGDYKTTDAVVLRLAGDGWNWTLQVPGQPPLLLEPKSLTWVVCPVLPIELKFDIDAASHRATGFTLRTIGENEVKEIKATR